MPNSVHIISDNSQKLATLRLIVERKFSVTAALLDATPQSYQLDATVISVDLRATKNIVALKQVFAKGKSVRKRIFVMDDRSRLFVIQAYALGATNVIFNPVDEQKLLGALRYTVPDAAKDTARSRGAGKAAAAGAEAIAAMFSSVLNGQPVDAAAATFAGAMIADSVEQDGLSNWLDTVRQHHEGTYQHCLLVTGVAVDFGLALGMAKADIQRLYSAAMFHDIGKAAIPAAVLNKPGKLDPDERRLIETHPVAGYNYLKKTASVSHEILDAVRHHHEYLDGSGYPDHLHASGISDVVRILTISDIFAALIENRHYKPPIAREQAYNIITAMRGKLEAPLVQAFKPVAMSR